MEKIMQQVNTWIDQLAETALNMDIMAKALGAVVGFFIIWLILRRLYHILEMRIEKFDFFQTHGDTLKILHTCFVLVLVLVTGTYLIRLFHLELVAKLFYALLIVLLARPVTKFLTVFFDYLKKKVAQKTVSKVDDIVFDLCNRFSGVIIWLTAVIIALDLVGLNVMPFVAGAGVAGIAIGFAAKDTLSNLIAGVLLIIDRPFEIGDRIEVWSAPAGSSTWGDVIDIGIRATKIRTTDHIVMVIPNNEIMKRDIINYTTLSAMIRVRINIGIAYDANIRKAKEIISAVALQFDWIAKEPPPKVVVRNFGESSVSLQLRVWIHDARKRMDTISNITDQVKEAFDREGIEIPYPKRDITIRHTSA